MGPCSRPRACCRLAVRLPRAERHARERAGPAGCAAAYHFLRPEEMELIVRVLENRIQKCD